MSVAVHPSTMGLPPTNGVLAQQVAMVSGRFEEEECPLMSHGQHMEFKKEEDFAVALTNCERVPGDSSTTFATFMVHTSSFFFVKSKPVGVSEFLSKQNYDPACAFYLEVPIFCWTVSFRYLMVTMDQQQRITRRIIFLTM